MLAIIMHTTLRVRRTNKMGNPIRIMHNGLISTMYSSIDNWKFMEAFPFICTQADSSLFDNQHIIGPIIAPKGKKKPAKADRWHNIDQFLSVSDNTLFSSMTFVIYLKDGSVSLMLH
jgi:hypothetical protein